MPQPAGAEGAPPEAGEGCVCARVCVSVYARACVRAGKARARGRAPGTGAETGAGALPWEGRGERSPVPGNTAQANVSGLSQKPRGLRNTLG